MLGFSVFLKDELTKSAQKRILDFKAQGFTGIFTSINMPEDDADTLLDRLFSLGEFTQKQDLDLTVDIAGHSLKRLNLSWQDLKDWHQRGINRLRMDDGITMQEIADFSQITAIALNASTITAENIAELKKYQANFSNLEAWHNYYPRRDTGLNKDWFIKQNRWLKQNNFTVMAFVPGDAQLRGPVYETLPTLEEHRFVNPLAAVLELQELEVDKIFLGDEGLSKQSAEQFKQYFMADILQLYIHKLDNAPDYIEDIFHQRADLSDAVIRLTEGRLWKKDTIKQANIWARTVGAITLDNDLAKRYAGEIQIIKKYLPANGTVNVIGYLLPTNIRLLEQIKPNQAVRLVEKGANNEN